MHARAAMTGFWVLAFMWLKFATVWRFFRLAALLEGLEPPDNMRRCFANNYDIEVRASVLGLEVVVRASLVLFGAWPRCWTAWSRPTRWDFFEIRSSLLCCWAGGRASGRAGRWAAGQPWMGLLSARWPMPCALRTSEQAMAVHQREVVGGVCVCNARCEG